VTPNILTRIIAVACAVLATCAIARAQSLDTSFNPGANSNVNSLAVQPDGKILVGGNFTTLGGGGTGTTTRNKIGRLNADGSLDLSFNPGANGGVSTIVVQADGKILLGGGFTTLGGGGTGTTSRNYVGRLNADGSLDTSFNPGANYAITVVAVQPDGKILVGGYFTTLGGGGIGTTSRNYLGRLNADGSLDTSFNPGANGGVSTIVVQADGKILLGGGFTTLGGGGTGTTSRNYLGRLNADGSLDTSFNPGANNWIDAVAVQANGKILVGGYFTMLGGGGTGSTPRSYVGRLNADGSLDPSFNASATDSVYALAVQPDGKILVGKYHELNLAHAPSIYRLNAEGSADGLGDLSFEGGADGSVVALAVQPDGKILVGGFFTLLGGNENGTTPRNRIGRLNADGSLEVDFNPGANYAVFAVAVQADGKILVGGAFTTLGGGGTGTTTRNKIGRLNADGSLDATFDPGANSTVLAMAVQADGKILIGGAFTTLGGGGTGTTSRNYLGRLNADGSLDTSFNPGANSGVYAVAVQADGKILVGGGFTTLGGGGSGTTTRNRIGRLNADGSLDTSFNPGANDYVYAVAVQADGQILVGGYFTTLGGGGTGTTTRNRIGRLNADGSLDTSFNPGANNVVQAVAVEADGQILVGGSFTTLGGGGTGTTFRDYLGRLNADGSLDTSFNPGANNWVDAMAVQADGKILVGGAFTTLGGGGTGTTTRNRIGRLNADGSLDATFDPGANNPVFAVAVQADGKILVGGYFTTLGGGGTGTAARSCVGRLTNTDAALQSLSVTTGGMVVTWSRSGAAPEVGRVTFESSTNGVTYTSLGSGTRVSGGWQLTGQSLPTNQNLYIRARGYYASGHQNGSGSIVESIRNAYVSATAPTISTASLSAGPGGGVYNQVLTAAGGASPLTWTVVSGALPPGLTLSPQGVLSGTPLMAGTYTFRIRVTGGDGAFSEQDLSLTVDSYRRYFAEGAATGFFDCYFALANPSSTTTANVTLTFLRDDSQTFVHTEQIPPLTRRTVNVKNVPGMTPAYGFSTILESNIEVVADRTMTWDATGYGSHAETAIKEPAQTWYLAEGATQNGFQLYYLIENPNPVPVDVRVTYLRLAPNPPFDIVYSGIPAYTRKTLYVNAQDPRLASGDVSGVVTSLTQGGPIIVERAMYLDSADRQFDAGHDSAGVTTPATDWFLAEGATVGTFDMYVLLANPGDTGGTADITYMLTDGRNLVKTYPVAAHSRQTVWVNGESGNGITLSNVSLSAKVHGTVPIIVERAMWWSDFRGGPWIEAHDAVGTTETGTLWAVADGEQGGSRSTDTYVLVANTSPFPGRVRVTLLGEDGSTPWTERDVPANSRSTFWMGGTTVTGDTPFGGLVAGKKFGALVESVATAAGTAQIVVERAMYSNANGVVWAAGTDVVATRLAGVVQTPTAFTKSVDRVGECRWNVYIQLSGFNPNSQITVHSSGRLYSCVTGVGQDYQWTAPYGSNTDSGGSLQVGYVHGDYGTYNYTFSDSSGRSASVTVSYQGPSAPNGQVRVLYVIPQDREYRPDYAAAVGNALSDLQLWYRDQLGGRTFSLFSPQPESCRLPRPADYYSSDSWNKVFTDIQSCAPVSYGSTVFVWVLYVDIVHTCGAPGRLGAGTTGLTMMARPDLEGLIGAGRPVDDCGVGTFAPITRYIGGLAHELGNAFGLSHPPGCDSGSASCDYAALMWAGYLSYPNTYLRPDDKQILFASPFIR
jgi:uncharacterized delta-60 repeat protein